MLCLEGGVSWFPHVVYIGVWDSSGGYDRKQSAASFLSVIIAVLVVLLVENIYWRAGGGRIRPVTKIPGTISLKASCVSQHCYYDSV